MKKYILFLCAISLGFVSCENFLDQDAPSKILSNKYFKNESSIATYANGLLNAYMPSYQMLTYGDQDADYVARTNLSNYYTDGWSAAQQDGWAISDWKPLYNINYFLEHLREAKGVSEPVFLHYEGVGRFWRAWFYYDMLRTFGGVPWYNTTIDAEDMVALYKPRDARELVMHHILEDLNFAAANCSADANFVNHGVINRYIALAFKARVCLYEGTYRKYHEVNPETLAAWNEQYETVETLLNACVEASQLVMESGLYKIVNNAANVSTQYHHLFNQEQIDYTEIIWAREYSSKAPLLHETTWKFNSTTNGNCWSMTKSFLHTYLMRDGTRYTDQKGYARKPYLEELQGRDYRLQQTVITPEYKKKQNGTLAGYTPNFDLTRTGYQVIKWNIDDDACEKSAQSYNSLPIFRYAEVLLNYAEARAELGSFTEDDWTRTIAELRSRAGVVATTPVTYDPYLYDYFDQQTRDKWLLEIRRERGVELFMENLRYDDLMRWHLGHLIERPWSGIYCPLGAKQAVNTDKSKFICVVQKNPGTERGVQYIVLKENPALSIDGTMCLVYMPATRVWNDKMYLRPIPQAARDINEGLQQNPQWQ
ncbi:MAG: RagB/SusD family nutrient uptake outer membrane protein [Alistipes sp.]